MTTAIQPALAPDSEGLDPTSQTFMPYAQLAKMLVPSSGCLSLYLPSGDLRWSSEGFEKPDFRELVDKLIGDDELSAQGTVQTTSTGISAYVAPVLTAGIEPLGYLVVELTSNRVQAQGLASHLLNPLTECLSSSLALDAPTPATVAPPAAVPVDSVVDDAGEVSPAAVPVPAAEAAAEPAPAVEPVAPAAADTPAPTAAPEPVAAAAQAQLVPSDAAPVTAPDAAAGVAAALAPGADAQDLDFLIAVSEVTAAGKDGIRALLERCLDALGCESAAFMSPEDGQSVIVHRAAARADAGVSFVGRARRHLMAWAQLNNRPMIVNRVSQAPAVAPYKILACPVRASNRELAGLVALFRAAAAENFEQRDVQLLEFVCRRVVASLSNEAAADPLASLLARSAFERSVAVNLSADSDDAAGVTPGVLMQIGIDRLQAINDEFGLDTGDAVIRKIVARIRTRVRDVGLLTRLSGDSFALFFAGASRAQAEDAARRLIDDIARIEIRFRSEAVPVSVSIGIALRAKASDTAATLITAAAGAIARARREGGARFVVAADHGAPPAVVQPVAAAELRDALAADRLVLLAQPIVGFASSSTAAGYETLVRLADDGGNLLAPERFMSVARQYGMLPAIDTWVFSRLVASVAPHAAEFGSLPLGIAVNVSDASLLSPNYLETLVTEISESGLPGQMFTFEIAEAAAIANLNQTEQFIERLHETGARVALDRFGSCLASLIQLRRLRVDHLKVAGALVRAVPDDPYVEAMLLGLAQAAQSLDLPIVAEQIENEPLAEKLEAMGFGYGQGFAFGKPAAFAEVLEA